MERLSIVHEGREVSHLAVRFDRPLAPRAGSPTILYLHGFASAQGGEKATHFRRRALESGFTFCSFDFQGHGESGGEIFDLTLSRNLEDLDRVWALVAERGCERPVLVGSSMGGGVALWYAARHPDRVAAAMHVAPSLELEKGLLRRAGEGGEARWRDTGRFEIEHELGRTAIGWGLVEDLRTFALEELRARYRTPTLLLQGKKDASVPWRAVLDFVVGCRYEGLELHLLADGDHRLLGYREHLWRLMLTFLEARGIVEP